MQRDRVNIPIQKVRNKVIERKHGTKARPKSAGQTLNTAYLLLASAKHGGGM